MAFSAKSLEMLAKTPPPAKPRKCYDERGLYLKVTPKGKMYWQWKIATPKETVVSYGTYPEVSLAEARRRHEEAREQRRNGIDPNTAKRLARLAQTQRISTDYQFETIAHEWFELKKPEWAEGYATKVLGRLKNDIFPRLGKLPIADITPVIMLDTLRKIESRGVVETAARCLEISGQVIQYAIVTGRCTSNPCVGLRAALRKPPPKKHMAAVTDPERLGQLLRMIDGYKGGYVVRAALRLLPILMLRPNELRFGRWEELDLETGMLWTIPSKRMKGTKSQKESGLPHLVPLPRQAVAILKDLHEVTGEAAIMFPGKRTNGKPISTNTLNAALRALGIDTQEEMTGHGFRATARTLIAEQLGYEDRESIIEAQLAHKVKDALGRAYNRTKFIDQRRQMLQTWADYLDELRAAAGAKAKADVAPTLPSQGEAVAAIA